MPGSVIFAAWTLLNEEGHHEHVRTHCLYDQDYTAPQHVHVLCALGLCALGNRMTKQHAHSQEKITYPYMHVRSKTFPWGDCGLFEHCEEEGEGEE